MSRATSCNDNQRQVPKWLSGSISTGSQSMSNHKHSIHKRCRCSDQSTHVELYHSPTHKSLGSCTHRHPSRHLNYHRGFAHAGTAYDERVIVPPSQQFLEGLGLAADQWVHSYSYTRQVSTIPIKGGTRDRSDAKTCLWCLLCLSVYCGT